MKTGIRTSSAILLLLVIIFIAFGCTSGSKDTEPSKVSELSHVVVDTGQNKCYDRGNCDNSSNNGSS